VRARKSTEARREAIVRSAWTIIEKNGLDSLNITENGEENRDLWQCEKPVHSTQLIRIDGLREALSSGVFAVLGKLFQHAAVNQPDVGSFFLYKLSTLHVPQCA
jgi:hypothetical protein